MWAILVLVCLHLNLCSEPKPWFAMLRQHLKCGVSKQHEPSNKFSGLRFRLILPNCIASLSCHTSYMHHARSFAVVLNSPSGVSSSALLLHGLGRWVDASVDPIFGWTFSNVFRRAPPPFYLSYFYSLYSLLLIYCYLCCDALVSVPVISLAASFFLGHILLPVVW